MLSHPSLSLGKELFFQAKMFSKSHWFPYLREGLGKGFYNPPPFLVEGSLSHTLGQLGLVNQENLTEMIIGR